MPKKEEGRRIIAQNKKAYHDYFVNETYEAGISLAGTEVKSLRAGKANLRDAYCTVDNGQLIVVGLHISPYEQGNIFNKDPLRPRVLLMHKREIFKLYSYIKQDGLTLIPLSLYFSNGRVKVEVGLCKGKKLYDKRQDIASRDAKRTVERALRQNQKGERGHSDD